ncbi:MAG: hypothetical protein F6K11_21450, partial [Leptolyngbya sp. SIO3F4]|nr:hypothetical protein [Leptolyngbya sp. SIO3F4]
MRSSFPNRFAHWCRHNILHHYRIKLRIRKIVFLALVLGLLLWNGSIFRERGASVLAFSTHQRFIVSSTEPPVLVAQAEAVPITSAANAVAKFTPSQQLYIKGRPLTTAQVNRLLTILHANPNVFVVVMDHSADMVADEEILSRGIANSSGFKDIRHPITEERQGILFMVYFDSNFGRQIGMRAEELPDRLRVGEKNFADEYDNPLELLTLFRNAVHQEGKDLPGALEVVINRINGTIRQNVDSTVGKAQRTVAQANTALTEISGKLTPFQSEFPKTGAWAKPNVSQWQTQLQQAQTALDQNHLTEAQSQAQALLDEIREQESQMSQHRKTVAKSQRLIKQANAALIEISGKLQQFHTEFPQAGAWSKPDVSRWQAQLQQAQTDLGQNHLPEAQNQAQTLLDEIREQELQMNQHRKAVTESQQLIEQANTALIEISGKLQQFYMEFPKAGAWAKPDVSSRWQAQLQQAQTDLGQNHFAKAQNQAQTSLDEIQGQELRMNQYREAMIIAPQLETTLNNVAIEIGSLPQNTAAPLNQLYEQAQSALRNYHVQIQEGQPKFWEALQTAQTKISTLQGEIQRVQQRRIHQQITLLRVFGGLVATLLTILLGLWLSAKNTRLESKEILKKNSRKLTAQTQVLLQLMEDAEYHSFKSYTGVTATHAKTMLTDITEALALAGGAGVVLSEAEKLVRHKGLINYFWSGHCRWAIDLLTDASTALPLQKVGNLQALLKNQEAYIRDMWRSHLYTQTDTGVMNYSFQNILERMTELHKTAVELLQELVKKDHGIGDYLSQIEVDSQGLLAKAQTLPTVGKTQLASEPWFTLPSMLTVIAPLLLEKQGYISQGRSIMATDPINAWDHYGDGAKRIVQEATT